MTITFIVLLILFGLGLLLLEIFFIPGLVTGILGVILMVVGIGCAYYYYGSAYGSWILLGTVVLNIVAVALAFRAGTWKKMSLGTVVEGKANVRVEKLQPGDKGITVSRLAPIGSIMIRNNIFEAESQEGFIPENKEVVIVRSDDNKIFVKLAG